MIAPFCVRIREEVHTCDLFRRRRHAHCFATLPDSFQDAAPQESNTGPIDHRFEDPQLAAQRREQSHAVQSHPSNLPENKRQMIRLYFEEGCSFKEISQKLNVPIGTIGPTLMRAEEQLRRKLSLNPSWKPLQANEPS